MPLYSRYVRRRSGLMSNDQTQETRANVNEQKTNISVKEASEIVGCSPRKIQKMIKSGTLSAKKESGGRYLIDKSEFYRVFPANFERTEAPHVREHSELDLKFLIDQNDFLKEQLKIANEEKKLLLRSLESTQKLIELKPRRKFLGIF